MVTRRPLVLVVEDNEDLRSLLLLFFLERGCDIAEASNGKQGVRLARKNHPDLVLTDLNLPYLDGLQVTCLLKKHADTEPIPVVAMSAYCPNTGWMEKAIRVGCDYCIAKPINFDELAQVLEVCVPRQRLQNSKNKGEAGEEPL